MTESGDLTGRVALVSGANRGIGLEISRRLAAEGVTVLVGARDEEKAGRAVDEISAPNHDLRPRVLDVTDEESIEHLIQSVEREFGRLDILVNNAGVALDKGVSGENIDLGVVRETLEINLLGAWGLSQAAIPLMRRNGYGRIVNVSSGLGALEDMGGGAPAYRISKTSLNALTRILSSELRGTGILVNSVCPGWVQTGMGGSNASRPVEEGAETPVWAATLPANGPTGGFFRDRRQIPW
ncbi:SDR family oxidoreductase [Rubrobacter aplysinae]|uniref:SDR family oxidoreductase n=1 Tax=Rubrobacter aplysinae TaxID=909625 RepID=UPI00064BFF82|nr:SDR family oxidoreductase [Rubrobacter aplysinae]